MLNSEKFIHPILTAFFFFFFDLLGTGAGVLNDFRLNVKADNSKFGLTWLL